MSALGAVAGAMLAGGVLLTVSAVAQRRAPSLSERIAPYVEGRRTPDARDDLGAPIDAPVIVRLLAPVLQQLRARVPSLLGSDTVLEARLAAAGDPTTAEAFRMQQMLWGLVGSGTVLAVVLLMAAAGRPVRPVAAALLLAVAGTLGVLLRDRRLTAAVRRRREAVEAGLPVVADLLALAVASGESPAAALARVARVAHGPLAEECGRAMRDAQSGLGLVAALEAMARRVDVPAVGRFVDGVAIAVQRGTPLGDVLRAQAGDARAEQHRALLETAAARSCSCSCPSCSSCCPRSSSWPCSRRSPRSPSSVPDPTPEVPVLTRLLARTRLAARSRDRGDVPGWVLVAVMTAGLVTALWLVADGQLTAVLQHAITSVTKP